MENKHGKINDENKDITTTTKTIITVPETPSTAISSLPSKVLKELENALQNGHFNGYLGILQLEDNMMPELCEWIFKLDDKLRSLSIFGNCTSTGASFLFNYLKSSQSKIRSIGFTNFNIDDECMTSLGEYLQSNQFIQEFELTHSRVSDKGVETLTPYLKGNQTLIKLNLSYNNQISSESVPLLRSIIESSHIQDVDVADTSITAENILVVLLASNTIKHGFRMLELTRKSIDDVNIIQICEVMKKYGIEKLEDIQLNQNQITSKGACILFETLLGSNSVITSLNLNQNRINNECMELLGKYIQNNEHIEDIYLASNYIGYKGIKILSEYLTGNTTLCHLNLEDNDRISDDCSDFLSDIATKSHVTRLYLDNTSMSEERKEEISTLLQVPTDDREIPIKSNTKSAAKIGQ